MIEEDLISGLFECPDEIGLVKEKLIPEDFINDNARTVYKAMLTFDKFDSYLVGNYLRDKKYDVALKWMNTIIGTGFGASIEQYAKEIKYASLKRQKIKIAEDLIRVSKSDMKPNEIIEYISGKLMSLYEDDEDTLEKFGDLILDYIGKMKNKVNGSTLSGLSTGWGCIDTITDGLGEGQLIIIGARPSMGKTSIMTHLIYNAIVLKKCIMAFSVESNRDKIIEKMISQVASIDAIKFKNNNLNEEEKTTALYYFNLMSNGNFFLNDSSGMSIYKMRSLIRQKIKEGFNPDVVMIDYLQIMQLDKSSDNMAVRVGRVAQGLKNIAKELNCPVVALAQLNRDVETNSPTLHSLKSSGDIEQIADQVWLLHRKNFYMQDKEKNPDNKIVIDICKNREGMTNAVELNWIGRYTQVKE